MFKIPPNFVILGGSGGAEATRGFDGIGSMVQPLLVLNLFSKFRDPEIQN